LWCKCWSLKYFLCWSRHGKYNTNIYFCANPVWCCSLNVACSVCCYKQAFVFWGHIAYTQCICIDVAFCYTSHVAGTGELCKMAEPMGSRLVWAQKPYIILGEGSRFTHRKENFWRRYMCWLVVANAGSITLTADVEGWTQTFDMQFEIEHEYVVQLALVCKVHRNYAGLNDNPTQLACYVIDRELPVQVDC